MIPNILNSPLTGWAIRTLLLCAFPVVMIWWYRAIGRALPSAKGIVAFGIVARAALGVALFFVSYGDLPQLRSLHFGDGFWVLALDARGYYEIALLGVEQGLGAIPADAPSAVYVQVLAVWMTLTGVSPASGLLLNLCSYMAIAWLVVSTLRHRRSAALVTLAVFTLSPSLVIFGSQPLKDVFFVLLIVVASVGAIALGRFVLSLKLREVGGRTWGIIGATVLSTTLMAGIRAYYPVFVLFSLACALGWLTFRGRGGPVGGRLLRAAAVLVVLFSAWGAGLGPHYDTYLRRFVPFRAEREAKSPSVEPEPLAAWDRARSGFIRSGGATNVGGERGSLSLGQRAEAAGTGLLLLTVPITILKGLGLVTFEGGRGLTLLADIDTLFIDASLLGILVLLWRNRRGGTMSTYYLVFTAVLAISVGLSLAYVVTNFGTLFRLRLLLAVPLWMLPLALAGAVPEADRRPVTLSPQAASR